MEVKAKPTPEEFFAAYAPQVRDTAMRARDLVLSLVPGAVEQVDTADKLVTYGMGPKLADQLFYISAHKVPANLGLLGAGLPDPTKLMEGTGKRLRHVNLRKPDDVENPALRALLEEAIAAHKR